MGKLILAGRTDVEQYFEISGQFESEELNHTPFLVYSRKSDDIQVTIIKKPSQLLAFDDDTQVMSQWRGEWKSDYFQFTVGQLRKHVEFKNEKLKLARNVVIAIGPQGGFKYLTYELQAAGESIRHFHTSSKEEANRLEAIFKRFKISITTKKLKKGEY